MSCRQFFSENLTLFLDIFLCFHLVEHLVRYNFAEVVIILRLTYMNIYGV